MILIFDEKYDVIISSLAIHHINEDFEKIALFQKIFNSLKENGVFYNADVVLGSTDYLHHLNLKKWIDFMKIDSSENVYNKWINAHKEGDHPSKLTSQMKWLNQVGFNNIDVVWKYYGHCVYGGKKTSV